MKSSDIFISYSWKDKDVVESIDKDFQAIGITLKRDVRDIGYKESIKEFMKKIRKIDYVLMIISDSYLKSENCMYEVLEFIKDESFKDRILPIVLDNAFEIFKGTGSLEYIRYWENTFKKQHKEVSETDPMNSTKLYEQLRIIEIIKRNIGDFICQIKDMNIISLENLKQQNYRIILQYINFDDSSLLEELMNIYSIKNKEEQENAINDFIKEHPKNSRGYFFKGKIYYERKKFKEALLSFTKAINLEPEFADAYNNRGVIYKNLRMYEIALEDYSKSIELNPEHFIAYMNQGNIYNIRRHNVKAIEKHSKAIELNPEYATAYFNRGLTHFEKREYIKGTKDCLKAIKLNPNLKKRFKKLI
ncbi:MAG: tetratricopeptide repeat protein [Halanaerobiales bacterium]|nr:tetratricopeptide repeat protein [Halanaerobiales bacterium]